jgi:YfiH family protein
MADDIRIHQFGLLNRLDNIVHGVFARQGGISSPPFDSLNVGMNTGDNPDAIAENRKRIILKMGMKPLIFLNQIHDDTIKVLKKDDPQFSVEFEPGKEVYTADAVVTDMKGVFLVIQVADCQSVMLADPEKEVVANIHSGWRGSVKNIIGKCISRMQDSFGCRPKDIVAAISPSLGPCCAEFINYKDEIPKELWGYKQEDRDYFDFWEMSENQLIAAGVQKRNIENMKICTKCSTKDFYSFRARRETGRFACVIAQE